MPIITIIDEQRAAISMLEALARLGLAEPQKHHLIYMAMLVVLARTEAEVREIVKALE